MDDDSATLGVGFAIDFMDSFGKLKSLDDILGETAATAVREFNKVQNAANGAIPSAATVNMKTFGNAATREMQNVRRETNAAEKAGEAMVKQLQRQIETYGKTAAEIRNMRAEQRALATDSTGLTVLSDKIRDLNGEMVRLESRQGGSARSANGMRFAMQGLSFQAQDTFTQLALGANPLQVLAIQGGQAAGQMAGLGGKLGSVANFLIGPWGLALTGGILLLSMFIGKSDEAAQSTDLLSGAVDVNALSHDNQRKSVKEAILALEAKKRSELDNMEIARKGALIAHQQTEVELSRAKALLASTSAQLMLSAALSGGSLNSFLANFMMMDDLAQARIDKLQTEQDENKKLLGLLDERIVLETNKEAEDAAREREAAYRKEEAALKRVNAEAARALREGKKLAEVTGAEIARALGTTITSGKRSIAENMRVGGGANSYHLTGNAIDIPLMVNGQPFTKEGIREALAPLGVEIKELLGPGDKGHSDHFHIAFANKRQTPDQVKDDQAKAMADEQRAYDALVKSATDYAAAQKEMAAQTGMSARDLRLYADAAAIAKAPTDALKDAIRDAATLREAAHSKQSAKDFDKNIIQPLRDELALYGLVGPARDAAALALEKQAFITANMDDGVVVAGARWEEYFRIKSELIAKDAAVETEELRIKRLNQALAGTAELWDSISRNVNNAAAGMEDAFGRVGGAIGDLAAIYADFHGTRARADAEHIRRMQEARTAEQKATEVARFGLSTSTAQLGLYGDMAAAAKGFFSEKSKGYKAIMAAEKVFRAFEFAMSVRAMVQDIAETVSSVANSGARATAAGAEGVATQSKLPFPFNIAAMAATAAALVAAGIAILGSPGGGSNNLPQSNTGTGTVLGDSSAQSESIKNAISALKEVDVLMLNSSRQMAASLQNIEDNISGFASLLVRNSGSINASGGVSEGFNPNVIGSVLGKIPLIGGLLKGLFGTSTTIVGSGLFGKPQSLDSILNSGFDASYYSDVQKKKKFLGITTSNKFSTQYTGADGALENQFTLILRSFNSAILAAAGPLGASTNEIEQRLNGFVLNIGKIDLKGLSGEQIEEKLNAVFGAAADDMARTAFPLISEFQKVGEGAFETLVRVASTIEAVGASLNILGQNARGMGIAAKLGLADQFESVSALTSAVDAYFQSFYTKEEQAAARTAQMASVFQSLGLTMPTTLAAFRQLVEAQDLTSISGQATYATLLKLAPAFADLQSAMEGAKSAADIASERADLQRQLLELQGDTAALRALQLAKLDASNRALQLQIYAIQDAQAAARAADELRQAWKSVGDTIMDEVRRIRGLTDAAGGNSFAVLLGQFNAASTSARAGNQDAAKSLPQLSQALLTAAAEAATSRQELDRIRAQTAASLEATYGVITALAGSAQPISSAALLNAVESSQPAAVSVNDNDSLGARFDDMRDELATLRAEHTAALATIAANTGAMKRTLDNVTSQSGGDAVSTVAAA